MPIGQVITNMRKVDSIDFIDKINRVDTINFSLPTLVVGKKLAESIFGTENIKIIDKRIQENIYWTYSKTERFSEYEKGIDEFNKNIIKGLNKNIKYKYFNILTEPYSRIKSLIRCLRGNKDKVIYITYKHIYIYSDFKVLGISIDDINYLGINKDKILSILKSNKNNKLINNDDFLSKLTKKYIKSEKKLIPYLYFINNH